MLQRPMECAESVTKWMSSNPSKLSSSKTNPSTTMMMMQNELALHNYVRLLYI